MIKHFEDIEPIIIHEMKGGFGDVIRINSAASGEYDSAAKVVARLILKPGTSIGYHAHEGDEEIMTILSGTGNYTDVTGTTVVKAGDVTICRNGEEHAIANASDTEDLELMAVVIGV